MSNEKSKVVKLIFESNGISMHTVSEQEYSLQKALSKMSLLPVRTFYSFDYEKTVTELVSYCQLNSVKLVIVDVSACIAEWDDMPPTILNLLGEAGLSVLFAASQGVEHDGFVAVDN